MTPTDAAPADQQVPPRPHLLHLLPLPTGVVFPDMVVTVVPESDQARLALRSPEVVVVPVRDGTYATVGVVARVEQREPRPDGGEAVLLRAQRRVRIGQGSLDEHGALAVTIDEIADVEPSAHSVALAGQFREVATQLLEAFGGRRLSAVLNDLRTPGALADSLGWWPDLADERRVELLETIDVEARIDKALTWAREALAEVEVFGRIGDEVRQGLQDAQREVILRRQLEAIRKELGETGTAETTYRERLAQRTLPAGVTAALEKEITRLERLGEQSQEAGWIQSWLDTVLDLPWDRRSADQLDLAAARAQLDADHTGLAKVKERVIEFLAVHRLRAERAAQAAVTARPESVDGEGGGDGNGDPAETAPSGVVPTAERDRRRAGSILLLVGPPGVGKTSLGESVAAALGRVFVRMSLGGIHDEAEIRGHRRTYVGARPGRIARALIDAGTMNPVLLLDEVDKLGADWRGDPSSALLEVLDPAQNHTFRDHYLELDLDLSEVVFIATANTIDRIPGPLLDRMEVLSLEGYSEDEKLAIARDHLMPRLLARTGLLPDEVVVSNEVVRAVIGGYTREAGVRRLEQRLERLVRRAVSRLVGGEATAPVAVELDDIRPALGRPIPQEDPAERTSSPGVATGLAVTGGGGDVLFVEAAVMDGEPGLTLTGQLGEVMQESGQIALSYLRAHREELALSDGIERRLHVHFPAGAVPKDGPSAGITMTTAIASLLSGRRVRPDVAMTGEVTLHGRVLPIGGVKEKVLAAHRHGVRTVVLPAANGEDLEDLPADVRDAVTIHLVHTVPEVLRIALA